LNIVKNVIAKLNTAHKNHKKWLKFSSMLFRNTLEKGTAEYNDFVIQTVNANTEFNKSFQINEEHIKLFENVIQVSCKVCLDYCSDDVKKIVKHSLESTHNYLESIEYLIVYLNQVKKYINSQKSRLRGNK